MPTYLTVTAQPNVLAEALRIAGENDAQASEPEAAVAEGALNAGIDLETVRHGLEFATLAFKSGTAAFAFLTAFRAYFRSAEAGSGATVRNANAADRAIPVGPAASDQALHDLAGPD
jgi:hypothetical protein